VFANLSFDNTSTEIIVTKGVNQLTASTSYPPLQFDPLGNPLPNGRYITTIASIPTYISASDASGNRLFSGSIVPPSGSVATTGNLLGWDGAIDVNTRPQSSSAEIVYKIDVENGQAVFFKTQSFAIQYEGNIGPGLIMRGVWDGTIQYIFDVPAKRRDVVIFPGDIDETYYWASLTSSLNQLPFTGSGEPPAGSKNEYWEFLGKEEFFVAAKMAIFEESFVKNTINVGNNPGSEFANIVIAGGRVDPYIAVGQNGTVGPSGTQSGMGVIGYNSPGIFMGTFDSSGNKTPRFSLVTSGSTSPLRNFLWNGETLAINAGNLQLTEAGNLTVTGTINANAGNFTNTVNVGSGATAGTLSVGTADNKITISGTNNAQTTKIFAGVGEWNNPNTGFYVDANGRFSLKNALNWDGSVLNITGSINITGGDTFNELQNLSASLQEVSASAGDSIVDTDGRIKLPATPSGGPGLFLGSTNLGYHTGTGGDWKTYMSSSGDFFLSGVGTSGLTWSSTESTLTINGTVNASAGSIGGWVVDGSTLRDTNSKIKLDPVVPAIEIFDTNGDLRLNIKQGDLPNPASTANFNHGLSPSVNVQSELIKLGFPFGQVSNNQFSLQSYITASSGPIAINVAETGFYTVNSPIRPAQTPIAGLLGGIGQATINYGLNMEFHTVDSNPSFATSANVSIPWGFGNPSNLDSNSSTMNFQPSSGPINIFITAGTYYVYLRQTVSVFVQPNTTVEFNGFISSVIGNTFNLNLDKIDITDQGILVIGNNDNFARIRRTQTEDVLTIRGSSQFSGSVKLPGMPTTGTPANVNIDTNSPFSLRRSTSSERYKLNIEDLNIELVNNSVMNLRPVWYRSNPQTTVDRPDWSHIGLIAEEVSKIEPRLVIYTTTTGSNGEEILIPESVQYERIGVILLSHIQTQTKVIQELSKKVTDLEQIISGSNNL
jgi:hypothetical protein